MVAAGRRTVALRGGVQRLPGLGEPRCRGPLDAWVSIQMIRKRDAALTVPDETPFVDDDDPDMAIRAMAD
jgi:hypothetical protein